ncbi:RraA family protein [Phytoactinopolyspora halotolerans]|uniref:Putative 4-hydroxy-4-methyl-2-oxoglutarate aldolase n=1 Tax=Phytoactinopolyspora halotolerans TaxID=1981512 RepID=A0A6L9SGD3_9ACTN|nr:RraA family protein [Phytoactinopolyspora halotolerans]NEE04189.1 RraA family protein [Phytoactinopolyspora halotolerans]
MTSTQDIDLDVLAEETYSAVFSDICDQLGFHEQTALPGIAPIGGSGRIVGWARPFVARSVGEPPSRPYGNEIDFIDSLGPGDVPVGDGTSRPAAAWGELFSCAARGRGARGAVIDGYVRDVAKIRALGFPVSARGSRPTDSLGRVSLDATVASVHIGGTTVVAGDLIVADDDGVTVVPRDIADDVAHRALEKATTENMARQLLLDGGKLADVWERHGVM